MIKYNCEHNVNRRHLKRGRNRMISGQLVSKHICKNICVYKNVVKWLNMHIYEIWILYSWSVKIFVLNSIHASYVRSMTQDSASILRSQTKKHTTDTRQQTIQIGFVKDNLQFTERFAFNVTYQLDKHTLMIENAKFIYTLSIFNQICFRWSVVKYWKFRD